MTNYRALYTSSFHFLMTQKRLTWHSLHAIFNLLCFYGPEVTCPTQSIDCNTALNFTVMPVVYTYIYRVSHELRSLLRESIPYVKLYRYNPKHLFPKLNGLGDNGKRKVWTS